MSEDLSIEWILAEKKYGSTGLSSKKTEALYGASKERKQPAVVTLQQTIFYNIFSLRL